VSWAEKAMMKSAVKSRFMCSSSYLSYIGGK